jgi:acyl carrier protein
MNTLERLTHAFRKAFGNEEIVITENTTSNDIDDWDSFTHINLILAIEHEFGIEFKQNEIQRFANVGELVNNIEKKLQHLQGDSA